MAAPVSYYSFLKTAWIGLKDDPCVVSMSPAVENVFSHGTEVAGIPKMAKNVDTVERSWYLQLLACHHSNGFNSRDAWSSLL
jgi:hypothetical protein